jgi:hypothetical protein
MECPALGLCGGPALGMTYRGERSGSLNRWVNGRRTAIETTAK